MILYLKTELFFSLASATDRNKNIYFIHRSIHLEVAFQGFVWLFLIAEKPIFG